MTTTEIAQQDAGTLEVFPPARAHSTTAVAMLHEHAEVYNTAWKLAGQLVQTTMVPKRFLRKQGDATAAILFGAELGLNPIQSLQRVIPIHGMPSLEARTMVGLLKAKGYKIRTTAQSDTSVTVEGESPEGEKYTTTWTIERARLAGYVPTPKPGVQNPDPNNEADWVSVTKSGDWGSKTSVLGNMKYITDPQTMLKAKGQAEVCRELGPDVLMGIAYSREELESEDQRQFESRNPVPAPTGPATAAPVTVDEIFAEEAPLPDEQRDAERYAEQNLTGADAVAYLTGQRPAGEDEPPNGYVAPEQPAGDTKDQGAETAAPADPSPAAQPTMATSSESAKPEPEQAAEPTTKAAAKKIAAKRSTAPAADPDRPRSRMRAALEKRHFALMKDAGLSGDKERDGRLAVYRSILERADINSADDLDDTALTRVSDQLYVWSEQNELDDQIAGILADAARELEETAAATAEAPTSEGNE